MINELFISNFKSIEKIELKPAQFNLFIGKPNVGKSNILEAISLLGIHHLVDDNGMLNKEAIRYEKAYNLFNNSQNSIDIKTDMLSVFLSSGSGRYEGTFTNICVNERGVETNGSIKELTELNGFDFFIDASGQFNTYNSNLQHSKDLNPVRAYIFKDNAFNSQDNSNFDALLPPNGDNLFSIIAFDDNIHGELKDILSEYDLTPVFIQEDGNYKIQKDYKGRIVQIPFSLIASTLKRYLFHLAAIKTNRDKILLFEEPEANSFPGYIDDLSQEIIRSSNQYFITTHSPYIYDTFVNRCDFNDLNIYYVDYINDKTKVTKLDDSLIKTFMDNDMDVFINIENWMHEDSSSNNS